MLQRQNSVKQQKLCETNIKVLDYNKDYFEEQVITVIDAELKAIPKDTKRWVNVSGLQDIEKIRQLCMVFGVHPLILEDILNPYERPKYEDNGSYLYVCVDWHHYQAQTNKFSQEQVSFILGKDFLISFCESDTNIFESVRKRITSGAGRTRSSGSDYLLYTLLDVIIDDYFIVLEELEDQIEQLEDVLLVSATTESLQQIQSYKRKMMQLHKSTWPMREVVGTLSRLESSLCTEAVSVYMRDLYDHIFQVIDSIEVLRDIISGLLDIYLSTTSNKMNEIMKVLTIISTIFIPLSFITSYYGMNFRYMPELYYKISYPAIIALMLILTYGMILFFKKRKWW